ncbi:MAG: hypothetical protein JJE30_15080 [Desulfuromonadales bacterium]|nr:hypothetical protein [Desulfuromonadales bacterium]
MRIQRIIWAVGRISFYAVLLLLLVTVIYALSHDQMLAGLISGILLIIALYFGLIRLKIPAYSVVVRDDKVVFFIPETTVRNRFDFVSRGQTIVELPHYGLLDRPYKLEIFFPDSEGGLYSCRLTLDLDYLMEPSAWQRAYDSFVLHQERLSLEVKGVLMKSAARLAGRPVPLQGEEAMQEYLKPIVAELNHGLESVGLKIEEAKCSFTAGSTLVRLVATEQEILDKRVTDAASGGGELITRSLVG